MDVDSVNLAELPTVAFTERKALPDVPAVYFVLDGNGDMLYIGQSLSIARRWVSHSHHKKLRLLGARRIAWLTVSDPSLLLQVERACIEHFQPSVNGKLGRPPVDEPLDMNLTVRITPHLYERLEHISAATGLSIGTMLRDVIERWATREERALRQPRARREEDA